MFKTKICGITTKEDARHAAACGAGAIGLNFYPHSPRYVQPRAAREIIAGLAGPEFVGVFVNEQSAVIREIVKNVGLTAVQLHGDEPPQDCIALAGIPVIKAFRLDERGLRPVVSYLDQLQEANFQLFAVLLDAAQTGSYGGTGKRLDWKQLAAEKHLLGNIPLILAGGLTPENVSQAIEIVQPAAVDTASGVEISPGIKDAEKVKAFLAK